MIDYSIIASGSKGNAVRVNDIMFDCGVPFKDMKEELYKCNFLFITHIHGDHIKAVTLKKIVEKFPRILIIGNSDVAYQWHIHKIVNDREFEIGGMKVLPMAGEHDVEVTYYYITMPDGEEVVYATDTCRIENPDGRKIDYFFLESNYDEHKLDAIGKSYSTKSYDARQGSMRHLSTQKAKAFYYTNRRNKDSVFIELHKSSRFY